MWMQGSTCTQPWQYKEVRWLIICSAAVTSGERPSTHRMLDGPQEQPGHEGVNKNMHTSDSWDRPRAVQPVVKSEAMRGEIIRAS